jgi:hypothetical protein
VNGKEKTVNHGRKMQGEIPTVIAAALKRGVGKDQIIETVQALQPVPVSNPDEMAALVADLKDLTGEYGETPLATDILSHKRK